jgi:NADPH-dependent 2,4-dienoyl-CoA reductase/sulfur reductase-like enzyme
MLAHRTTADLEAAGLDVRLGHATAIEADAPTVTTTTLDGTSATFEYDRLVVRTGAVPARPPIEGLDRLSGGDGVHVLHTMGDTFDLTRSIEQRHATTAVVVGAGYIGLEMAEALTTRGLQFSAASAPSPERQACTQAPDATPKATAIRSSEMVASSN